MIMYNYGTAQGNLIPTRILQLEISYVKITSCVQYLNGCLLATFMPASLANRWACVPTNISLILNKLFDET